MRALILLLLGILILPPAAAMTDNADPLATFRPVHPYLLFTDADLAVALAAAKTDPLRAALHAEIVAVAEAQLKEPTAKHLISSKGEHNLLDEARTALGHVVTCAMAFRLTGDARFADRAKQEMIAVAAFPDWNPDHFLDVAELSMACGIGYDWLYPQLTSAERATIRQALMEKSLVFAPAAYGPPKANGRATDKRLWFAEAVHNWNQVCNGGLLAAALAVADEEPATARLVINGVRTSLPRATAAYAPDGAYPEGPGYWLYGTSYNVLALAMLDSALGTDFDLGEQEGFERTALYRVHVESPSGLLFNYADGGPRQSPPAILTWLARRFDQPAALEHNRAALKALLMSGRRSDSDHLFALHAVWFPTPNASPPVLPLDVRFRGRAELAFFRGSWDDASALWVGFKAGSNAVNHSHLDLGSFVLDADGVRWAEDLGPDNYALPGYFDYHQQRWAYYRMNNRSHNTLTPGDALQKSGAVAPMMAYGSTRARAFAVADLTAVYPAAARKIWRGIALLDRSRVLVQDEVVGLAPATPLVWRLLTAARVNITDDHHATLVQKGHALKLEVLEPATGHLTTTPARPDTAAEMQNEGTTVLTLTVTPDSADARLAVLLTPVGKAWPVLPPPELTPLTEWK